MRGSFGIIATYETSFKALPLVYYGRAPRGSGIARQRTQHPRKINVCWAATRRYVADPLFYTNPLNGHHYASILRSHLRPPLQRSHNRCGLTQDNLCAHYTAGCRDVSATQQVTVRIISPILPGHAAHSKLVDNCEGRGEPFSTDKPGRARGCSPPGPEEAHCFHSQSDAKKHGRPAEVHPRTQRRFQRPLTWHPCTKMF